MQIRVITPKWRSGESHLTPIKQITTGTNLPIPSIPLRPISVFDFTIVAEIEMTARYRIKSTDVMLTCSSLESKIYVSR